MTRRTRWAGLMLVATACVPAGGCTPAPDEEEWAAAEALDAAEDYRIRGDVGAEPVCAACSIALEPAAEIRLPGTVVGRPEFGHVAADSTRVWISLPGLAEPLLVYDHEGQRQAALSSADGVVLRAPLLIVLDPRDTAHVVQRQPGRYVVVGPDVVPARSYPLSSPPSYLSIHSADRLVAATVTVTPRDMRRLSYLSPGGEYFSAFDALPPDSTADGGRMPARNVGTGGWSLFALSDEGFSLSRFRGNSARHDFTAERPWGQPPNGPQAPAPLGLTMLPVPAPYNAYRILLFATTGSGAGQRTVIDALHPLSVTVVARTIVPGRVMPVAGGWAYRLSDDAAGGTRLTLYKIRLEGDPTR